VQKNAFLQKVQIKFVLFAKNRQHTFQKVQIALFENVKKMHFYALARNG